MKRITDLTEQEVLALAITSEEEDSQIYMSFANRLRNEYPSTAQMFEEMAAEEQEHKNMLLGLFQKRFGGRLPYITRQDVRGFMRRNPLWLMENMRIDEVRQQAELMEIEASTYYSKAAAQAQDVEIRKLLGDLALAERGHEARAIEIERKNVSDADKLEESEISRRLFVLQVVQPGLAGLIDGSVSTLAPIFAAAFATHNSHDAFLVGLAASLGAGISMGLTEAMSDDGAITGRGSPWLRGVVCGLMTTLGGLGHTLPYLISDFWTATLVAAVLVALELIAISWIRWKYMDTPIVSAMVQVILGGALVLVAGILIGSA
ncbi:MAG: rubrerythrin [Alphaproteobacteria bacterium]|jgi:rubrerythrin|nr:rubrerythrin [Alphaproteobacteria bacterium]MCB1551318.1 rubrerythrin [Alphaproteobacteria bacterium]MCB9984179.1 rubrerythrin [Micavibrio sp.]HPQ50299.1 ferritin family protein [Alphaproteobacteria bacterium]HRK97026.1 ferritin family protein [Alphaproteobacteria bacterium]